MLIVCNFPTVISFPPKPWTLNITFDYFLTIFGRFRVMSIRISFSKGISRTIWAQNFQKRCLRYWLRRSAWPKKRRWKALFEQLDIFRVVDVFKFNHLVYCIVIDEVIIAFLFNIQQNRREWLGRSHGVLSVRDGKHGFETYHEPWNTTH